MFLFLVVLVVIHNILGSTVVTVVKSGDDFEVKAGVYDLTIGVAVGKYDDDRNVDGYEKLELSTNSTYCDEDQMFAAGIVEGYLTQNSIYQVWENYLSFWKWPTIDDMPKNVSDFMDDNMAYTISQAEKLKSSYPFYRQVFLLLQQLKGMVSGYNSFTTPPAPLTLSNLFLLNSAGDLYGVLEKFLPTPSIVNTKDKKLSCSALVRATDDELYFAHITWRGFEIMNKFYKKYTIPLSNVNAETIVFTSSPGFLTSKEDYYLMDSGLAVTETTNGVYNLSLYDQVFSNSLLYWPRITAANRLATTTYEWMKYMAVEFSGTYTNQWIVVDYNLWEGWSKVTEGNGLLMIGSEMPSLFEVEDVTRYLIKPDGKPEHLGFWPSYNVPYFPMIYNISGYEMMYEKHGDSFSYKNCPRAKIFNRDAFNVKDMDGMKKILLYNDWKNDPFQLGDPANGIAARYDLRKENAAAFGGIDGKITTSKMMKDGVQTWIHGGPTNKNDDTPPFKWSEFPEMKDVHKGQPDVFNFDWVLM